MSHVELRISGGSSSLENICSRLNGSIKTREHVVFPSSLPISASLSDHLVWIWGALKHQRRLLKRFQSEGAKLEFVCLVAGKKIQLRANAAEMLHLIEADLTVEK
jgi:hypothetical protein